MQNEDIIKEFQKIRDIPFRIALSPGESSDDCLGKADRLFKIFKDYGYAVRYRVCKIKWSTLNLPEEVTKMPHDDNCSHTYLEVKIDGQWKIIDVTWDSGLKNFFPVNEWDDKPDNKLAIPCLECLSPEESLEYIKRITTNEAIIADLEENGQFYKAMNEWLEKCRK
jgi:hypothetical protein